MGDDVGLKIVFSSHLPKLVHVTLRKTTFALQSLAHSLCFAFFLGASTHASGHQECLGICIFEILPECAIHDLCSHHVEVVLGPRSRALYSIFAPAVTIARLGQ